MVQHRANGPQRNIKILKETAMEAKGSRILRVIKLAVQGIEAELKISVKEDI